MRGIRFVVVASAVLEIEACRLGGDPFDDPSQSCPRLSRPELAFVSPGETGAGELRIRMHTGQAGQCGHNGIHWLSLDGGVQAAPAGQDLSSAHVTFTSHTSSKEAFTWAGQAAVVVEKPAANAATVTVDFTTGPTLTFSCSTSTGTSVACQ